MCDTSLEKDCIMKRKYYSCIFRVSFLSFFSSIYAIYCECYDLAPVPGGVFLTSVNYWRRPTYGWRRNLDMGYVTCAVVYQNYRAYYMTSEMVWWYYFFMFLGVICYPVSVYLYKKTAENKLEIIKYRGHAPPFFHLTHGQRPNYHQCQYQQLAEL